MNSNLEAPTVNLSRVFDAPVDRVYAAWTEPSHLLRWYAPEGCRLAIAEFDLRPGGRLHLCIEGEGFACWIAGQFTVVESPRRFAYLTTFSDAEGNRRTPTELGRDPEWPEEVTTDVQFEDLGGRTRVTIRQDVAESVAIRTGAQPSWLSQLDQLARLLESDAAEGK